MECSWPKSRKVKADSLLPIVSSQTYCPHSRADRTPLEERSGGTFSLREEAARGTKHRFSAGRQAGRKLLVSTRRGTNPKSCPFLICLFHVSRTRCWPLGSSPAALLLHKFSPRNPYIIPRDVANRLRTNNRGNSDGFMGERVFFFWKRDRERNSQKVVVSS